MKSHRSALVAALAIVAALCISSARAYQFVPILSVFYAGTSTTTLSGDQATCLARGGYLATEATATLHTADIEAIKGAIGTSTEFYAFLGGGINTVLVPVGNYDGFCPWGPQDPGLPTSIDMVTAGLHDKCLYRWRVGRWMLLTSDTGVIADEEHAGIAFYQGQGTGMGSKFGFPTWFFRSADPLRPGLIYGRTVVLFQNSETITAGLPASWTDNFASGGYTYAGQTYGYLPDEAAKTLSSFRVVCQGQGPFRLNYEAPSASTKQKSDMQYVWWVIFFVILFVLCLIAFLIVACCQEREDMDEPPEDAPEWAERETEERNVSKRYVSQRSFRGEDDISSDRSSSRRSSSGHSRRSSGRSTPSKEDAYSEEQA